jgi:hypothetical protein
MPPIVVMEGNDLVVYATLALACHQLEAVDVNDGVYEAFDSEGRPLRLLTHGIVVSAELAPNSTPSPEELERRLRRHIHEIGPARAGITRPEDAALPVMLEALSRFHRHNERAAKPDPIWVRMLSRRGIRIELVAIVVTIGLVLLVTALAAAIHPQ